MLARWAIRLATSLAGVVIGIVLSGILLDGFSANVTAIVWATVLFWFVHFIVLLIAVKAFVREPSISLAGLLALASTIVSLLIVNLLVPDMSIKGLDTYVIAALIIWLSTAIGDIVGNRMIRARRRA